jgi:hypothetical protein
MDLDPENKTLYSTQYQEAFQKYVDTEYCTNQYSLPVIIPERVTSTMLCPSARASGSGQYSFD